MSLSMNKVEFQISRKMIDWIADKEGITVNDLADKLVPKKQDKFLNGIVNKSIAEKLVKLGKIPFGYLFLQTPPESKLEQIPDFRQTVGATPLTKDFYDTFYDIEYKQSWYKEYLHEVGNTTELDFVGKFKYKDSSYEKVATDICNRIGFDITKELPKLKNDSYFKKLSELIEKIGILVFKNGIVGTNTHRPLNVQEFRGFAIADKIAPIIFINGNDSFSAQIFTLCHELAHIWVGETGVSNWSYEKDIESFCNKVAAEILMPHVEFCKHWNTNEDQSYADKIENLSNYFKVSKYTIAIKALTLNLISNDILEIIKVNFITKVKKSSSGGNFYNNIPLRNSNKLTNIIVSYAITQKLPLREAGNLLNIKADTVIDFYKHIRKL